MFCTYCGKKIDDDSSFCVYCGKSTLEAKQKLVQQTAPAQASAAAPVPTPNPANPSQAQTPAGIPQNVPQANNVTSPAPAPTPVNIPPTVPPMQQPLQAAAGVPQEPKKKSKRGGIIAIIIALLVIIGIVVAGFLTNWFGLAQVSVKSSVNEYSWDELSRISSQISDASDEYEAISIAQKYHLVNNDGKLDGNQTKDVTLSDGTIAQVQIAGIYHDEKTDGNGKAGLTFIFKDGLVNRDINAVDSNDGGWERSQIRTWLASDGMDMLPQDLQRRILSVNKKTNNIGQSSSTSAVTVTQDKLWLFSPVELFGATNFYKNDVAYCNTILNAEGEEYELFRDNGTSMGKSNSILVGHFKSSVCSWWTRSPVPSTQDRFCGVNPQGNNGSSPAADTYPILPGFAL